MKGLLWSRARLGDVSSRRREAEERYKCDIGDHIDSSRLAGP